MKVFISSPIAGMEDLREAAARAVRSLGHEVIRAEDFGAAAESAQVTCLKGVREADAVVLLIGERYGAAQSSGLSATHEEYHEARERCPVLVMVAKGAKREDAQTKFLDEARDWNQGHYTESFGDAEELRDAVVGALHNLELARATGPVDSSEMLERAIAGLPSDNRRSYSRGALLALALTGGPLQTVVRPARLESNELRDSLHQMALFGEAAVLSTAEGTETRIEDDALVLVQRHCTISIDETGTCRLVAAVPAPEEGLPVIIEEDVREIIARFLKFADAALGLVDPVNRLSHVAIGAKLLGGGYLSWRTRAEHARSPNRVSGGFGDDESEPVSLSPPHRTRAALRQTLPEIVDDLTVKLRRQLKRRED